MDDHHLQRLATLEHSNTELRGEVRVLGSEVTGIKADVHEIGKGVKQLLDKDIRRGEPASWKTAIAIGSVLAALGTTWATIGWMIQNSEPIKHISERVQELDHPRYGRVTIMEQKVQTLTGWDTRVTTSSTR